MNTTPQVTFLLFSITATAYAHAEPFLPKNETELGRALYQDKNLSLNRNQACATCHTLKRPSLFVDPDNAINKTAVSKGSVAGMFGGLNAPSVGYVAFSPAFYWDDVEGLYKGGQFWDGRAKNLQQQAKMPLLNPVEMAMPSQWAVVSRLKETYTEAFKKIYALNLDNIAAYENAPSTINAPIGVSKAYNKLAQAIAAFEKSRFFNRFTSKYDFYLMGKTNLSPIEQRGLALFEGKAQCSACHTSTMHTASDGSLQPPLLTDFSYDNIGLPRNVLIPHNPQPNLGLGGRAEIVSKDPQGLEIGKHKVMSLRNIALTAPYGHNGVFKTLKQVVNFYNTRDVLGKVADNADVNFGVTGWSAPEVAKNLNTDELGNLGLTDTEEKAIVAFMKTLTDDYPTFGNDPNVPKGTPSPFPHLHN